MYEAGDYIVYGTNGVCLVTDVVPSPFDKADTRTYYVLKPVSGPRAAVIYTPVDNERVPMRSLMTEAEAQQLFSRIHAIPPLTVANEKARRETYRVAVATGAPEAYISVIKTIRERRLLFAGTQRRLPEFEMEYDMVARRYLISELSLVLGCSVDEIEENLKAEMNDSLVV